jgi:hypothetical protein
MKKLYVLLLSAVLLSACGNDPDVEPEPLYTVNYYVKGTGNMNIDSIQYLDEQGHLQTLTNINYFSKEFKTRSKVSTMLRAKGYMLSGSYEFEHKVVGAKSDIFRKTYSFSGSGVFFFDVKKTANF